MLECFHPSSKLTEPNVFCSYLGTDALPLRPAPGHRSVKLKSGFGDGIDLEGENHKEDDDDGSSPVKESERLNSLYSRFRPDISAEDEEQDQIGMSNWRRERVRRAVFGSTGMFFSFFLFVCVSVPQRDRL